MTEAQSSTALIALLGVIVGAVLTGGIGFFSQWIMRNRDLTLKLWEKFLDRRISAHDDVVALSIRMRIMVSFQRFDSCGELVRVPHVMMSKEGFDQWLGEFSETSAHASTWLSTPVKRELNFVQDYFATLHANLADVPPSHFATVGLLIRKDFIDLSSSLEKAAFEFFKSEARTRRLNDLTEWHKYLLEETTSRLQKTELMSRWTDIQTMIQSNPDQT